MAISEKDIFESLMRDPNHAYNPIGKVWAEAQQRARQFRNNEKALALAFDEPSSLNKLQLFLTKNVSVGDINDAKERGFDVGDFQNDYIKLYEEEMLGEPMPWEDFKEKWAEHTPFIHRAFGLDLDSEDRPPAEDAWDDETLREMVDNIDDGRPVKDYAPKRVVKEPRKRKSRTKKEEPAESLLDNVPEETPSLNDEEEEHLQGWLDSVYPLADHKEIREGIINQLNEDGFEQLREQSMAWDEILQRAQAANLVPEFPSEEPSLDDPQPQAESLLDETAETEPKEKPTFLYNPLDDDAFSHIEEAASKLPTPLQPFEDDADITWNSYGDMMKFMSELFNEERMSKNYGVYSAADVQTDPSLGENNWDIPDISGVIQSVSPGGKSNREKIRALRNTYINWMVTNRGQFEDAGDAQRHLLGQISQRFLQTFKGKLSRAVRDDSSTRESLQQIADSYNMEHEFIPKEAVADFTDNLVPKERKRGAAARTDAQSVNESVMTDTLERTFLTNNNDALDAADMHLFEWDDKLNDGRGGFDYERPLLAAANVKGGLEALRLQIPQNAIHNVAKQWGLRQSVGTVKDLHHLSDVIHRLNQKAKFPDRDEYNVSDKEVTDAFKTYNSSRIFTGSKEKRVVNTDVSDAMTDAISALDTLGLNLRPGELPSGYVDRITRSPRNQFPWIGRRQADEEDEEFVARQNEELQRQLNFDANEVKLSSPKRVRVKDTVGKNAPVAQPQITADEDAEDIDEQVASERQRLTISPTDSEADLTNDEIDERLAEFERNLRTPSEDADSASAVEIPENQEDESDAVDSDDVDSDNVEIEEEEGTQRGDRAYRKSYQDWQEDLQKTYGDSGPTLDEMYDMLVNSIVGQDKKDKKEDEAGQEYHAPYYQVVKKWFGDAKNGKIENAWRGRSSPRKTKANPDGLNPNNIHSDTHPNFEGKAIDLLAKEGYVEAQEGGKEKPSGTNYRWTDKGQELLPLLTVMPRVKKIGELKPGAEKTVDGRNGLIPEDFVPVLIALHKNGMIQPSYELAASGLNDELLTNAETGNAKDDDDVDGDAVDTSGKNSGSEGLEEIEVALEDTANGGDNPDTADIIARLKSHLPTDATGEFIYPKNSDGEDFNPFEGDISENYTTLLHMFHDMWDKDNEDSIHRKHATWMPEKGTHFYAFEPDSEGFDTTGYNAARTQSGLLEGWLQGLQRHLNTDDSHPIDMIYARPSNTPSRFSDDGYRADYAITPSHYAWYDALNGMGFTDEEGNVNFAGIDHTAGQLRDQKGHGFSSLNGDDMQSALETQISRLLSREEYQTGEGFEEELGPNWLVNHKAKMKTDFLNVFGHEYNENNHKKKGAYGLGANDTTSFDLVFKEWQDFLKENNLTSNDYEFMDWAKLMLDGKNPEGWMGGRPVSETMEDWNFHDKVIERQKAIEAGEDPKTKPKVVVEEGGNDKGGDDKGGDDKDDLDADDANKEDKTAEVVPHWEWKDNPEELSGEYEKVGGEPLEDMPTEPPPEIKRRNRRINDIMEEQFGENWRNDKDAPYELELLLEQAQDGTLDAQWEKRVIEARRKKRAEEQKAEDKETTKKSNETAPMSEEDKQKMLKEIQEAYKETHGVDLDSRHQSILLRYAQTNPDQFRKEHEKFIQQAGRAKEQELKVHREYAANNLNGHGGIPSLAGRSDLSKEDLIAQSRLIVKWKKQHLAHMDNKSKEALEARLVELRQLAANVEDFSLDEQMEKDEKFAADNGLEYGGEDWMNALGAEHMEGMDLDRQYKSRVAQGGDLRANRNYKPWLVVKYDSNGNGVLCDLRQRDMNGDFGKPIEGGKRALEFDNENHYFDYKKDPEDLAQHPTAEDHFWTTKLDYANLRPHDGKGGVEDVPEFASHKGMLGERGAIQGWYHPESGAWINPHRYHDVRSELEGAGDGAGMAIISGERYHGSHRADGQGEVNSRYGFATRGSQQQAKLGNDDLSYYIDGQGNVAHAHGDWNQVQKRNNNQVQSVNDVIHDWHSQNFYNMATNSPDSFKDENGNLRAGTVLRPPQGPSQQTIQNALLMKVVRDYDALRRRRQQAGAMTPQENVYRSGLAEDELAGTGQFWSEPQEWKQKYQDVLEIASDIPFMPIVSWFGRKLGNIVTNPTSLGMDTETDKVIRRARRAYKLHAATQSRTQKIMDDLNKRGGWDGEDMRYLSPGESIARKEDTSRLRTDIEKQRRFHQRASQNSDLDTFTREEHKRKSIEFGEKRDLMVGLNPEYDSHWKQINSLHDDMYGGANIQEGLVPHPQEDVGVWADRLAQPLPSVPQEQQQMKRPQPISGLLEDVPSPQEGQQTVNQNAPQFRQPPYEGGGLQEPKAPITGLLG